MLTEFFLRHYARNVTQRYLSSEKFSLPPKPDEDKRYLLYVHIPFCEELCPYCSFIRIKFEPSLASAYFVALKKEIENYYNLGYHFDSIYVGGGTPTIMPEKLVEIISFAKSLWSIKEISIETNPDHLVPKILQSLKDIGTNRLSVGVQSFNNGILKSIGRFEKYGSAEEIKEKLSSVAGMFDTVNVDMIFNFPNQTEKMLAEDIRIFKETKVDQVTWYPLMSSVARKKELAEKCGKINYKREKRLYRSIVEQLTDTYSQRSVWCFSNKKGLVDEYIVGHDEYAAAGAGTWGYLDGTIYSNTFSVQQYIKMMQENKFSVTGRRNLSYFEKLRYDFLLKLFGSEVSLSELKKKHGNRFWLYLGKELLALVIVRAVTIRNGKIALTLKGRYYWLIIMSSLFSVAGDYREIHASLDAGSNV